MMQGKYIFGFLEVDAVKGIQGNTNGKTDTDAPWISELKTTTDSWKQSKALPKYIFYSNGRKSFNEISENECQFDHLYIYYKNLKAYTKFISGDDLRNYYESSSNSEVSVTKLLEGACEFPELVEFIAAFNAGEDYELLRQNVICKISQQFES